jgi:cell division protein FtsQ
MARKASPTIVQEELYPSDEQELARQSGDPRMLDLDADQESPFLRAQKRVSVRRGSIPKTTANRLKWVAFAASVGAVLFFAAAALYSYGEHSWRFRIESSDDIEIAGSQNVTHSQIMEVLGGDIGRNIFFIPLSQRKAQLEQIPWVESASIMRFAPNHLRVEIRERTPVAFARIGPRIELIDAGGALMDLPPAARKKYSFPVILGMNSGEPLSTRTPRMKQYNELVHQLDAEGGHYSQDLSEVDLTDPDDVKVLVADPVGEVLVHLGSSEFLSRYKIYVTHVRSWRQQFDKLESVDLRYDHQIIVNPDLRGAVKEPPLSPTAAKAAVSAGVKATALMTHEIPNEIPARDETPAATTHEVVNPAVTRTSAKSHSKHAKKLVAKPVTHTTAKSPAQPLATNAAQVSTAHVPSPVSSTLAPSAVAAPSPKPAMATATAAVSTVPATPTTTPGKKPSPEIKKSQDQP